MVEQTYICKTLLINLYKIMYIYVYIYIIYTYNIYNIYHVIHIIYYITLGLKIL